MSVPFTVLRKVQTITDKIKEVNLKSLGFTNQEEIDQNTLSMSKVAERRAFQLETPQRVTTFSKYDRNYA